jgi:hypothetical protein
VQAPVAIRPAAPVARAQQSAAVRPAPLELAAIADTGLRAALERMAHAIVMRRAG